MKKKVDYYTIGVRFLEGDIRRVYTYKVPLKKVVLHGDLLVADTDAGPSIVAVVRIDTVRQDTNELITYKYITQKVVKL